MIVTNTSQNYVTNRDSIAEVKKLPDELWKYILSFLGARDLQSASHINRSFTIFTLEAAHYTENLYLKNFADFIEKNSPNDQIKRICSQVLKGANLVELKSTILNLRDKIIDVLKTFEKAELIKLKALSRTLNKSHFFINTFYLASLYRQYDMIEEQPDSPLRNSQLVIIAERLRRKGGNLAKAEEAAKQISDKKCRKEILVQITENSPINPEITKKKKRNNCIIS